MINREPYLAEIRSHRGNLTGQPEHTVESYIETAKAGVSMIELDIQFTSDGVIVCIHDETVTATTNGTGTVVSQTLAQLKLLNTRARDGSTYTTRRIPTLTEALLAIKPYRIRVLIEKKLVVWKEQCSKQFKNQGFLWIEWYC